VLEASLGGLDGGEEDYFEARLEAVLLASSAPGLSNAKEAAEKAAKAVEAEEKAAEERSEALDTEVEHAEEAKEAAAEEMSKAAEELEKIAENAEGPVRQRYGAERGAAFAAKQVECLLAAAERWGSELGMSLFMPLSPPLKSSVSAASD
jgi:hypothetical protein